MSLKILSTIGGRRGLLPLGRLGNHIPAWPQLHSSNIGRNSGAPSPRQMADEMDDSDAPCRNRLLMTRADGWSRTRPTASPGPPRGSITGVSNASRGDAVIPPAPLAAPEGWRCRQLAATLSPTRRHISRSIRTSKSGSMDGGRREVLGGGALL